MIPLYICFRTKHPRILLFTRSRSKYILARSRSRRRRRRRRPWTTTDLTIVISVYTQDVRIRMVDRSGEPFLVSAAGAVRGNNKAAPMVVSCCRPAMYEPLSSMGVRPACTHWWWRRRRLLLLLLFYTLFSYTWNLFIFFKISHHIKCCGTCIEH